jgi:hypothetical protein
VAERQKSQNFSQDAKHKSRTERINQNNAERIEMSRSPEEIFGELGKEVLKKHQSDFSELGTKIGNLLQGKIGKESLEILKSAANNIDRDIQYAIDIDAIISSKSANLTPKQKSLLLLFWYLWVTEGAFSEVIETIAILLMQEHHDIYDPKNMEFVKNHKELEKIDLFVKIQFVRKHGFEFLCDCIDRNLRNSIAHLDIMVNDDGSIVNLKTGEKISNLEKSIALFTVALLVVLHAMNENLGKFLKTRKRE